MKQLQTYKNKITSLLVILLFFFLPVQDSQADHAKVLTSDIEFSCDQTQNHQAVKCAYRFVEPGTTIKISASLGSTELPIQDIKTYPFEDSTTSILFLVDSSKSDDPEQIQQTKSQIIALAQQALPSQEIGLATFDANLKIVKPLGSNPEEIIQVIEDITETNQPTELYRSILDALNLLKTSHANRKAIYVFSNGISEDQAIYHNDVIEAALEAEIKIISIAYPTTNNPTDTTRTLYRLSEESGGFFIKASETDFELPETFILDPFAAIENGGILTIDLNPVLSGDFHGFQLAVLEFETSSKRITVKLPLELSSSNHETTAHFTGESTATIDDKTSENEFSNQSVTDNHNKNDTLYSFIGYWPVIPIGLLIIGLSIFLSRNKKMITTGAQIEDSNKPMAWLISLTDSTLRYPINSSPWKVGRTRENNLFLEHSSVSRKHAEFKRNRDSSFSVIDLDSLNGVFVNNTKVSTGLIKDQDKVDIGDVRLKFVLEITEN